MSPAEQRQLENLVSGRWDPHRGVGPRLGFVRWFFTWLFLCGLIFPRFLPGSVGGVPIAASLLGFAYVVPPVGLIVCWLLPISIRSRARRRYTAHGGFLCPWCRYPLTGLPERGRCPECGSGFDGQACRTLYDNAYRAFQPDTVTLKQRERQAWTAAMRARREPEHP